MRLLGELDELHRQRVPWLFRETTEPARSREEYAALIEGPDTTLLIAVAPEVVGVALVLLKTTPAFPVFVPAQFGLIDNLYVSPSYRRSGVGTALTRAAEEWARSRGGRWLELGVYEFNEGARAFYEELGYATVTRKLYKPFT